MDAPDGLDRAQSPGAETAGRRQRAQTWLLAVIAAILLGWAVHMTGIVMVPVILSFFIALVVAPVDRWAAGHAPQKASWLGHVVAMGVILLVLLVFAGGIWLAAERVANQFPALTGQLQSILPSSGTEGASEAAASGAGEGAASNAAAARGGETDAEAATGGGGSGLLSQLSGVFGGAGGDFAGRLTSYAASLAQTIISSAGTTLAALIIIFFLTLLMLIEGPKWRSKLASVLDTPTKRDWFESLGLIAERLRRYLLARTILGVITGVLYVAWLAIFGVDLLIVWGLLAFLLNFVPNLGSLVAGILPVLYAFVQKDTDTALMVGAGIFVIEQVMGNFVDPRVQGRQVAVSPLVVLLAILLWGWIWGIAGAILAVPITIAMIIVFAHIPPLRPLALMLSDEPDLEGLDRISHRD